MKYLILVASRVVVQGLDAVGLFLVGLLGTMIAQSLEGQETASFLWLNVSIQSHDQFFPLALAMAGFFSGKSLLALLLLRVTVRFLARIEAEASLEVARRLYMGDIRAVKARSLGDLQWLLHFSTQKAFSFILFSAAAVVTEASLFLVVIVTFFFVNALATSQLLGFFILLILVFQILVTRKFRKLGSRTARLTAKVNNAVLDMVSVYREATAMNRRTWFIERFWLRKKALANNFAVERLTLSTPRYLIEAGLIIGVVTLVFWQVILGDGFSGLATIAVFLMGGLRMTAALLPMQNAINDLNLCGPQASGAQSILEDQELAHQVDKVERSDNPQASSEQSSQGAEVEVANVSFSFPDSDAPAVDQVSLTLESGSFSALIGSSGAGKTTVVDLILGIHAPSAGRIDIANTSPSNFRAIRSGNVTYVPQNPAILSGTWAQNVALGEDGDEISDSRVMEVLEQVGLGAKVSALNKGIHSRLGEQGDGLSGGELQRLGIARALYPDPKLIILDEATSGLDAENEFLVSGILEGLRRKATVLVIAHRLSTIQHADNIFVLDKGRVVDSGTFREIRRRNPQIERYIQLMKIEDSPPQRSAQASQ